MRDDDQSSFSILLTCGGVECFSNKVGVVENVEIIKVILSLIKDMYHL